MNADVPDQTPADHEDYLSQIPALVLLQALGYECLTPEEALKLRGDHESQGLLVELLAEPLRRISRGSYRGEELRFPESAIAETRAEAARRRSGPRAATCEYASTEPSSKCRSVESCRTGA